MAGSNVTEPQRIPSHIQDFARRVHSSAVAASNASDLLEPSTSRQGLEEPMSKSVVSMPTASSPRLETGVIRKHQPLDVERQGHAGLASVTHAAAAMAAVQLAPKEKKAGERTAVQVTITIGKSELEMLQAQGEGRTAPLARFTLSKLWLSFRCVCVAMCCQARKCA